MNFIKQIRKMLNIYVTVKISHGEKVHKKKYKIEKSNVTDTNYFTIFLQNVDVANLLLDFI